MDLYAQSKDDVSFDKAAGLIQIAMEEGQDDPNAMNDSEFENGKYEPMDLSQSPSNEMDDAGKIKNLIHAQVKSNLAETQMNNLDKSKDIKLTQVTAKEVIERESTMNKIEEEADIDMSAVALEMPDHFEDDASEAAPATDEEAL